MATTISGKEMVWAMCLNDYDCVTRSICPICGRMFYYLTDQGDFTIFPEDSGNTDFELALDIICRDCHEIAALFVSEERLLQLMKEDEYDPAVKRCFEVYHNLLTQEMEIEN